MSKTATVSALVNLTMQQRRKKINLDRVTPTACQMVTSTMLKNKTKMHEDARYNVWRSLQLSKFATLKQGGQCQKALCGSD